MCCCALTQVQGEVDRIGVLDTIVHGLTLPPRVLLTPVEVCQEGGIVAQVWVWRVTMVARARWTGLHTVVLRWGTADVWRHHSTIERDVLKLGHATAWVALVIAGVHCGPDKEVAVEVKREQKAQKRRAHSRGWIHVYKKFQSHLHPKQKLSCTLMRRHKCMKTLTWEKLSKKVQSEGPLLCLCEISNICSPSVVWNDVRAGSPLIRGSMTQTEEGLEWGLELKVSLEKIHENFSTCWPTQTLQHQSFFECKNNLGKNSHLTGKNTL